MMRLLPIAALAAVSLAQDENSPPDLRGVWEGTIQTAFAQANPNVPNSYECLPSGQQVSVPHKMEIGEYEVTWADWKEWRQRTGSSTWLFPAGKGKKFTWSQYRGDVARLRTGPETLECYYIKSSGTGKNRKLVVLTLGGAAYGWQDQCSSTAYKSFSDYEKKPYCEAAQGSRSPLKSTVLGSYSYKGGGSLQGSGAASTAIAAVSAVLAAVLGARLL